MADSAAVQTHAHNIIKSNATIARSATGASSNTKEITMPKTTLTAAFAQKAICHPGKRRTDYWCDQIAGFVLSVRESGGATWSLRYLINGRQRDHKIARYGDISFDQARKAARRLRATVLLGGDPSAAKQEKKAIPLYIALSVQHLAHAKTYMRSYDSLETNMRLHIVPRWGKLRLDEITPPAISRWLADKIAEGASPAFAEKLRVTLGRSFELARQWSIPGGDKNPARGVPMPVFDNRRERFLTAEEAGRLLKAAGNSLNPELRAIIALLLLTACRISELLLSERRNFDLHRKTWLIPSSKSGKARHVPLSQAAIDIINALPQFEGCPWLIPNPETGKPFVSIKHSWQKARKDARLPDLRIHDLRHSAASFMINAGVDLFAVGKVLGHADYKSTMRYSHLANETLLSAVEAGAAKMSINDA